MNLPAESDRQYDMTRRGAGATETRLRIADATTELVRQRWFDEITLKDIAAAAGVSLQTVVNHFGNKEAVFAATLERPIPAAMASRLGASPDDVKGAVKLLVADYEFAGDGIIRVLALEERFPSLRPALERGRQFQRSWLRDTFPAALAGLSGAALERRLDLLTCATDVYTWKLLRRDRGLGQTATATAIRELVDAVVECG